MFPEIHLQVDTTFDWSRSLLWELGIELSGRIYAQQGKDYEYLPYQYRDTQFHELLLTKIVLEIDVHLLGILYFLRVIVKRFM